MYTFIQYFGLVCIVFFAILLVFSIFRHAKNISQGKVSPVTPRQRGWYIVFGLGLVIVGTLGVIANLGTGLQESSFAIGQVFIGVALVIYSFSFGRGQKTATEKSSSKGMRVFTTIAFILFVAACVYVFNFGGLSTLFHISQ